jgi:hypothetical protein
LTKTAILAAAALLSLFGPTKAQVIGSYDNFDCFNDTGKTAEGFEIDVEDVGPSDITRIFPDNFTAGQPYIRWATPDKTKLMPVTFPDGHTGVSIIYAAQYVNHQWVTQWGSSKMPGTTTPIGNGTPYVNNPTYTTGDSCWTLGLGAKYPTSGCDHFGISIVGGKTPGKMTMHWLVPNPSQAGQLIQNGTVATLPPGPVLTPNPVPPGQPPVVHVAAEPVDQPEYDAQGLCSDALWLKTFKSYSPKQANLNLLQKNLVPMKGANVSISWRLLQHCPPDINVDKAEVEDDALGPKNAQMITRHEYYKYNGAYDDNHEVTCGGDNSCDFPVLGLNGKNEQGAFLGAHNAAYDVK